RQLRAPDAVAVAPRRPAQRRRDRASRLAHRVPRSAGRARSDARRCDEALLHADRVALGPEPVDQPGQLRHGLAAVATTVVHQRDTTALNTERDAVLNQFSTGLAVITRVR